MTTVLERLCWQPAPETRGKIAGERETAVYYTTEPSPSQRVAIGLLTPSDQNRWERPPCRLLVGCGRTERAAIDDLKCRMTGARRAGR